MTLILTLHSIVRWLITLVAVVAIVKFAVGWLRNHAFDKLAGGLSGAFSGLMDLQAALGVLYFLWNGFAQTGFPAYRWEHAVTMLLAVVAAHLPRMWKNLEDTKRYRNAFLAVLVALLLVFAGIAPIGGWTRWWHITGLF